MKRQLTLLLTIGLLIISACAGSATGTTETTLGQVTATDSTDTTEATTTTTAAVMNPSLTFIQTVRSPNGGVSGELLEVEVVNDEDETTEIVIPCGFIFEPESDVQRMMVIQEASIILDPGEAAILEPYVMCIDSSASAPDAGDGYTPGSQASGPLLALAECVCGKDLSAELDPIFGDIGLQMAVWAASDGELPTIDPDDLAAAQGAMGEVVGGDLGFDLSAIPGMEDMDLSELGDLDLEALTGVEGFDLESMLSAASDLTTGYQDGAIKWLDECGIDLGQ